MCASVQLNKINTFQREFAVIFSKSPLVALKMRYVWSISNRQWKGHTDWEVLMNWSGWEDGNKERSPRNPSDCNLILKSKRRRKENITQALSTESRQQETAVEEKGKCMEKSQAFNISAQWGLLCRQITRISPQGTMCFIFKGKRHKIAKLITSTLPSNVHFKSKRVLKTGYRPIWEKVISLKYHTEVCLWIIKIWFGKQNPGPWKLRLTHSIRNSLFLMFNLQINCQEKAFCLL